MKRRAVIHATGIVQGVGFRPFVYRVAKSLSLMGYVLNLGDAGVEIVVEGTEKQVQELIRSIKNDLPSISRIDTLNLEWLPAEGTFSDFLIHKSSLIRNDDAIPVLPPDIAICNDCVADLFDSKSRWYQYGFTSCAACGPRYSTITDLPYDRPNTTMIDFPLCDTCNTGYTDPLDRRYHAQTTACDACGPRYRLVDRDAKSVTDDNPIEAIAKLIDDGAIAALQGIAGTHIATKTSDAEPIEILRERKKRFQRPFALMVRDRNTLKKLVDINKLEDGEAKQELRSLQDDLQVSQEENLLAQDRIEGQRRLEARGFITPTELEAEELNVSKARNKEAEKETALKLYIQYTFPKDAAIPFSVKNLDNNSLNSSS